MLYIEKLVCTSDTYFTAYIPYLGEIKKKKTYLRTYLNRLPKDIYHEAA